MRRDSLTLQGFSKLISGSRVVTGSKSPGVVRLRNFDPVRKKQKWCNQRCGAVRHGPGGHTGALVALRDDVCTRSNLLFGHAVHHQCLPFRFLEILRRHRCLVSVRSTRPAVARPCAASKRCTNCHSWVPAGGASRPEQQVVLDRVQNKLL